MQNMPWTEPAQGPQNRGLHLQPNSPFFWMHHPSGWELYVDEEGAAEWLPTFAKLVEMPGVQGVRQTPQGADSSLARTEAMDQGFTILPRELGYVTRHKTRSGGWFYESIYAIPKKMGRKTIWKRDDSGYHQFRRDCIANGLIQPADPDYLEEQFEKIENRINRLAQNQHIPEVAKDLAATKERLAAMHRASEALTRPALQKRRRKNAK